MSQQKIFMNAADVETFIAGKTVRAFDPATNTFSATIAYGSDGSCEAHFETGETDRGQYGFEGARYWTRYEKFRAGRKHLFSLEKIDGSTVQAYYEDESKAFLMSHEPSA